MNRISTYGGHLNSFLIAPVNEYSFDEKFPDVFKADSIKSRSVVFGSPKKNNKQHKYNDLARKSFDSLKRDLNYKKGSDLAFNKRTGCYSSELPLYQLPKNVEDSALKSLKRNNTHLEVKDYSSVQTSSDNAFDCESDFPEKKKIKYSTPMTPRKNTKKACHPFAEKALKIVSSDNRELCSNNKVIKFKIDPNSKKTGDYFEVSEIAIDQPQLYDNYSNEQVLNKCYKKEMIQNRPGDLEGFMKSSLEQHNDLLKTSFPISKILNADTALNDGFFNVEKVEHEFPINWQNNTTIESLDKLTLYSLDQVKAMFQYAFDNDVQLDLSADNVRINHEGIVVLCDFMEEPAVVCHFMEEPQNEFKLLIEKLIKTFANGNEEIKAYLRPKGYKKFE